MFENNHKHHHHGLHVAENLKKAVKWYVDHAAENYVWSPLPVDAHKVK